MFTPSSDDLPVVGQSPYQGENSHPLAVGLPRLRLRGADGVGLHFHHPAIFDHPTTASESLMVSNTPLEFSAIALCVTFFESLFSLNSRVGATLL